MSIFRGFIAIDISASPLILDFIDNLKKIDAKLKIVEKDNIHLTIKFLGDTDEEDIDKIESIMKEAVYNIKPFTLSIKGTGVFPNRNYINVIWIGAERNDILERIARRINNSLNKYKKDKKPFSPHITIARVKWIKNKEQLLSILDDYRDTDFGEYVIENINLKKSSLTPKGPIYTTVRTVILG